MSINEERQNFINRFGPEQLSKYSGASLLKLIAAPKQTANNDLKQLFGADFAPGYSSMYQALEEETKSCGAMNGNMTATREIFYSVKEQSWKHYKQPVSPEEAILEAEQIKKHLLQAATLLEQNQFEKFYTYANENKQFFSKGFIHKYLYICFPEWIILGWHKTGHDADAFYKKELGIKSNELFSLEYYFYQKNPQQNLAGIKEELEEQFGIYTPLESSEKKLNDCLLSFIQQSRKCWERGSTAGSKEIKGEYRETNFYCSFGTGNTANTTFCAFLGNQQQVQHGIYPVILFNKSSQEIEVCYGVSANNTPEKAWPQDIIQGLRPSSSARYQSSFVFKNFIIPNTEEEIHNRLSAIIKATDHVINDFHQAFNLPIKESVQEKERAFPLNQILYGPPGTGKTYHTVIKALEIINNRPFTEQETTKEKYDNELLPEFNRLKKQGQIQFLTFHQNYSYEDFMVGIRPDLQNGQISYKLYEGPFKKIADEARKIENKDKKYVLIIDEINRGNISKIFGELITLIETDKRAGNKHALSAPLLYQNEEFSVPNNLYIIGTMNTADKSIALVDIALRRRFVFEEMMPKADLLNPVEGFDLPEWFSKLNQKITDLIDKDHQIGHSYFIGKATKEELHQVFYQCILPLLNEYFYGEPEKLSQVIPGFMENNKLKSKLSIDDFMQALNQKEAASNEQQNDNEG